jgi:genome maintenance exonuclease 1
MNMQKQFRHVDLKVNLSDIPTVNENGSRYYLCEGERYPSVTTVTGWKKRQFFAEWRVKNPRESKRVLSRGNMLHETIEDYLNNKDINLLSTTPTVATLFAQLKPELDKIDNILALEVPLWSSTLGLAGRVDCVAEYNGELCIIDFKGSTRMKRTEDIDNYFTQATAYAIMWHERTGQPIHKFNILMSTEASCTPQVFSGNPIDYVKNLHEAIKFYKRDTQKILLNK